MKLFWTNVEIKLAERGISKKELAAAINISRPHLSYMIAGDRRTHSDVYSKVIEFLKVEPEELFQPIKSIGGQQVQMTLPELIEQITQEDADLGAAIEIFCNVSDSERKKILEVVRIMGEADKREQTGDGPGEKETL